MKTMANREILLFSGLAIIIALVFAWMGSAYGMRMLVEASCYAIIGLGLTIQWGYAGLFNVGVMGFIASAAFASLLVTFPVNQAFWDTEAPGMLAHAALVFAIGVAVIYGVSQSHRLGLPRKLRTLLTLIAAAITYLWVQGLMDPATTLIERNGGWVGGLGLPVWMGWIAGGIVAGVLGWAMGRITLGLRADYMAIATLGISEIIKAFLKNADWLTRGTLTVSPLPWPVPTPQEIGFIASRSAYLSITAILIVVVYILLQRAWASPWGRMMRAIRDNEFASAAMGKDINRRRLEMFMIGNFIIGVGGAALVTFTSIFDPASFVPLNHTFLIWVMIIVGGAGNNLGTIFGVLLVYVIWTMSEPAALFLFQQAAVWGDRLFDWQAPADLATRALQMRVFVIGLTITLVLRFAPDGLLPEKPVKYE
ncbi:branched-chain amino acid ABC transporter permease [Aquamicrobium sp. LC103]|uniref:branched-chain amino acid ABC transporter permease n=1 Tax=Aquamicrobium sp. LC103 TaxID=1120658 RepID=UPI00063ECC6C|nr:branched-chain amino acid ABC transporter permease [Aquamicrobium sp. LC103]TKT75263.1 branched-chain amino acid ABC transporter permease [Aquamicrobium sp. LC103]